MMSYCRQGAKKPHSLQYPLVHVACLLHNEPCHQHGLCLPLPPLPPRYMKYFLLNIDFFRGFLHSGQACSATADSQQE